MPTHQTTIGGYHFVNSYMQNYGDADMEMPSFAQCLPMSLREIVYAFYPHARSRLVSLIYNVFGLVPMQSGFANCLLLWSEPGGYRFQKIPAKLSKVVKGAKRLSAYM